MKAIVVLEIEYDETEDILDAYNNMRPVDHPALWDWSDLAGEDVKVIASNPGY